MTIFQSTNVPVRHTLLEKTGMKRVVTNRYGRNYAFWVNIIQIGSCRSSICIVLP